MKTQQEILDWCRVDPGERVKLKDYDPAWAGDKSVPKAERKRLAEKLLSEDVTGLAKAQELLYASDTWSILLIFQALDAAGKDSTIKHVMSGVNPQGCQVYSFKHPSSEELDHTFLWRCMKALPERGRIGIFNRSYYEEVLIVKVHPKLVVSQRIPAAVPNEEFWAARYEDINGFERHLARNGTLILKFFLNVSKEEQAERFLARLEDPQKHWKFSATDLAEREYWDDYMAAYEECLTATSTTWAPWHIIPADHKWVSRAIVAKIITTAIGALDLKYPDVPPEKLKQIEDSRQRLRREAKES
jgi:PPK2 family polyphosphate:nucleotide phosphotransferase